jgi:hypothetical protein
MTTHAGSRSASLTIFKETVEQTQKPLYITTMSKTDEQIAKLEQELAKLKQIRLDEIEAAKPKPRLFDGDGIAGIRTFFELIERNAREVNSNARFQTRDGGKYSYNAIYLGRGKNCPWELLKDGDCLILKVKEPK